MASIGSYQGSAQVRYPDIQNGGQIVKCHPTYHHVIFKGFCDERGLPQGHCFKEFENGDEYEGDFEDGVPNGKGEWFYASGEGRSFYEGGPICYSYEGEVKNGLPHGIGKIVYSDLSEYEGRFFEGKRHGEGNFTSLQGDVCEGVFLEDQFPSRGSYLWKQHGAIYKGDLLDGLPHGEGILFLENGDKYIGSFERGYRHGKGVQYFEDKSWFEGEFVKGKPSKGIYFFPNGDQLEGVFEGGKFPAEGGYTFACGNEYVGPLENGKPKAHLGTLFLLDGSEYRGSISEKGVPTGKGILIPLKGGRYSRLNGSFSNGLLHGYGSAVILSGPHYYHSNYSGTFLYGKREGEGQNFFSGADVSYLGMHKKDERNGPGKYLISGFESIEGIWSKNAFKLRRVYLNHRLFLDSLLEEKKINTPIIALTILCDYWKKSKILPPAILKQLNSCLADMLESPDYTAEGIYSDVLKGKDRLSYFSCSHHAMLIYSTRRGKDVIFGIYNSGDGLREYHKREVSSSGKVRYKTMLGVKVPRASVTRKTFEMILKKHRTVKEAYDSVLRLDNAEEFEGFSLQTSQGKNNCALECIFAFLKNILAKTKTKSKKDAYNMVRLRLFEDCKKAVEESSNPEERAEFLPLLDRKIEKLKEKLGI